MATKRKRARPQKSKTSPQLLPPANPNPQPQPEPEKPGLVAALLGPFKLGPQPAPNPQPSPSAPSEASSGTSSELPPDLQAKLNKVPDEIGSDLKAALNEPAPGEDPSLSKEDIRDLLSVVQFDEADVEAALREGFDWIAEIRQRDCYRLTDRKARLMARPLYRMSTSLWLKLAERLPEVIINALEAVPGSAGVLLVCVPIVGGMVWQDFRQSKLEKLGLAEPEEKKPADAAPKKETAKPVPAPARSAAPQGFDNSGIPMAAGTVGGK